MQNKIKNMVYARTAHNTPVYASPPRPKTTNEMSKIHNQISERATSPRRRVLQIIKEEKL
jgi:hypothetical protein